MPTKVPSAVPDCCIVSSQVVAKNCNETDPHGSSTALYRPLPPSTSRELDVTFPHGDRRRAEIDEQRAVRAEAARAAGGGRAKLATLQPVACRERGALALAERRLARREPRERWDEAIQNIEPADRGEPFPERHRTMRDRRGNGIAHIHAHTDRQPLQSLAVPTALAQDARELALPQQHVVGPFEAGLEPAEEGIDRIRDGEPDARSEEHTAELQSLAYLVCRLLL